MRSLPLAAAVLLLGIGCAGQPRSTAEPAGRPFVVNDPAPDHRHPPSMEPVTIPSGGVAMNGVLYRAGGAGAHRTVVLLHGFPGNEQNLDLAQAIRRAGWNVLTFHYRGSWGSPGAFSFTGAIEDTRAAIAFVREASGVVLIGHNMGGFLAALVGASDPRVRAVGLIAAWDAGRDGADMARQAGAARARTIEDLRPDTIPLAGCTPEGLFDELVAHAADWTLPPHVAPLADRPVLVVTADDALAPHGDAVRRALLRAGSRAVTAAHFRTDHAFSDSRISLATKVVAWLDRIR